MTESEPVRSRPIDLVRVWFQGLENPNQIETTLRTNPINSVWTSNHFAAYFLLYLSSDSTFNYFFHRLFFSFASILHLSTILCQYDKELLVTIKCFEQWKLELMSTEFDVFVKVLIDYKNLEYFMITKQLNRSKINEHNFLSILISSLSISLKSSMRKRTHWRDEQKTFRTKKNDRQKQQFQTFLSFDRFDKSLIVIELTLVLESNRLQLMQKMHDQLAFDHLEINKTIKLLKRNYI